MANIGVILSGCGFLDGAEVTEAVCTLLALDQRGATYQCLAPKKDLQEVNHVTKEPTGATRCVLAESARVARGDVLNLKDVQGDAYDGFILPGGFGAAKNLCDFAERGADCAVDPEVARVLTEAHAAGRPLGFVCIAPAVAAKVFGGEKVKLTIGHDEATAAGLEALGAEHVPCEVKDVVIDAAHRIVSTPAYMDAKGPAEVYLGIDKLVAQVLEWADEPAYA